MARPTTIKDETIIDAARAVFLERGIQATTAEVADRAGVSEGSIFKRFKSKVDLFRAAMGDLESASWATDLAARVGEGDIRENLFDLGLQIIQFFRRIMPLMMLGWANPSPNGLPCVMTGPNPPPLRALKLLTSYFEAEIRLGRLRHHDPEIMARLFLGGCNHYVFVEVLHRENNELPLAPEVYVRGLVSLLWTGAEPRAQGR